MHLQSLGTLIASALAAVSQSQLYCQTRGKHVGATCPVDFNNVATVVGRMSDKMIGFGHALADVPVVSIVGGIASGLMGITYDVNGVPVPYHDEVFIRWSMYPPLYPPDPHARMMRTFAEDVRKWSATTDLLVVPNWPTDLIVWVPPHERLRLLMPPPVPKPDLSEFIDTVFQADSTEDDSESNLADLRLLLGFYALTFVSASLAIATLLGLEPARDARRGATMGDKLGVSAALDFIRLALCEQASTHWDIQQPVRYEVTSMNRRERRDAVRREHALMAGPRPLIAYDLANWSPLPRLDDRPLLFVHHDQHGSVPIARPPMRPRTWSSMAVTEARPAPSSRPMSNASQYEDETLVKHTLSESKALLRRQAPGIRLFGLWKSRVRRHAELRALRDEMGEEVARRHAQEGLEVLRQNLRSMMGVPGQPFVQADN